jgi:hypothetical protein
MTTVHKLEVLIIDHDDVGRAEIKEILEGASYPNDCINPYILNIDTREVEWADSHPLNFKTTMQQEVERLFSTPAPAAPNPAKDTILGMILDKQARAKEEEEKRRAVIVSFIAELDEEVCALKSLGIDVLRCPAGWRLEKHGEWLSIFVHISTICPGKAEYEILETNCSSIVRGTDVGAFRRTLASLVAKWL